MSARLDSIRGATQEAAGADRPQKPLASSGVVRALGGVALWALIVLAFQQGLQHGIGFSGEEAFVLAGGLGVMAGVLVVILLGVGALLSSDV